MNNLGQKHSHMAYTHKAKTSSEFVFKEHIKLKFLFVNKDT